MRYKIYRNLNNGLLSLLECKTHLVSGHASRIVVKNARLIINASGKLKALQTGQRNVHAFVEGEIVYTTGLQPFRGRLVEVEGVSQSSLPPTSERLRVLYNPFKNLGFHFLDGDKTVEIWEASYVDIHSTGVTYATV